MYTLTAKLTFNIPGAASLKDKRQARRSLIEKTRGRFNVSVSEVDAQDVQKILVIGIAVVSGEMAHAQNSLDEVIRFMDNNPNVELTAVEKYDA